MESEAAAQTRGRLAFSTCLDIQTTIHQIQLYEVEAEVERLIRSLSTPEGGFLATCYENPDLALPLEKVKRMWRAFETFRWQK